MEVIKNQNITSLYYYVLKFIIAPFFIFMFSLGLVTSFWDAIKTGQILFKHTSINIISIVLIYYTYRFLKSFKNISINNEGFVVHNDLIHFDDIDCIYYNRLFTPWLKIKYTKSKKIYFIRTILSVSLLLPSEKNRKFFEVINDRIRK
jgi:hypothetical protein